MYLVVYTHGIMLYIRTEVKRNRIASSANELKPCSIAAWRTMTGICRKLESADGPRQGHQFGAVGDRPEEPSAHSGRAARRWCSPVAQLTKVGAWKSRLSR